jgi:acetyl esterase/lipase
MKAISFVVLLAAAVPVTAHAGAPKFDVQVIKDVSYNAAKDADPVRHKLDLYLPKGQKDYPVLFFVHGGGWRKGSKDGFAKLGGRFAGLGIGTVVINYRLSPEVKHPGHVQDVARAFAWTQQNIGKYGGRADKIFISGHSAGGHLVALLATDEQYLKAEKLGLDSIKGVIPVSGPYQMTAKRHGEIFGDEESCRLASPINHVDGKRPPFLFLYAEKDIPMCGELSKSMSEALRKHKGEAEVLLVNERDHGSIMGNIPNEGDPAGQAVLAFIAKHAGLKLSGK